MCAKCKELHLVRNKLSPYYFQYLNAQYLDISALRALRRKMLANDNDTLGFTALYLKKTITYLIKGPNATVRSFR